MSNKSYPQGGNSKIKMQNTKCKNQNYKLNNFMISQEIELLKNEIVKSDSKLSDLLRKTKIIAQEINDEKFLKWIEKELNGYNKNDKVPEYRIVEGEPMGWNPRRGWIPFIHEDPKTQELLSKRIVSQSTGELENLVESEEKPNNLRMPYPEEIQVKFSKSVGLTTKFILFIPSVAIYRILNSVRNKLLDWVIEVDRKYGGVSSVDIIKTKKHLFFQKSCLKNYPKI